MIRTCLTYALIVLIAMQSLVAVADIHQLHQSGTQHREFEHLQDTTAQSVLIDPLTQTSEADSNRFDCQHCCHCHGTAHLPLQSHHCLFTKRPAQLNDSEYRFAYMSRGVSPDNPPPIS